MSTLPYLAGVELGGTKVFVLRARGRTIEERVMIPTTTPQETLSAAAALLRRWHEAGPFEALGIGSFGPLRLDRAAADFGHMLPTPKPGWTGADIYGALAGVLPCPAAIDTDVNGAALAEVRWGAGAEGDGPSDCLCYITIGTGLGAGFALHGRPLHGAMHPELGHIMTRRAPDDSFEGACPFHSDCIEGLVSGPALAKRFGVAGNRIAADDPRWDDVAHDIAQMVGTILLTTAARQVLIGGGVGMGRTDLLERVRAKVVAQLAGYLPFVTEATIGSIVRPPALGDQAGPLGAVALAMDALEAARLR
ncbi:MULTISPECIES: ROK family protein [Sphingobium]|uniref:fructokinase n=1 Tax=Sphingobium limneticum TaxID=1007511 RepID=A0A5J5IB50_9SPHN|nr:MULTISPECIES: ROK family protein [Sphingobium]KAA9020202.1 ROK family protein [Sphingobium limneticum]KAA9021318.1 ROK family protein [Sphingobium limneticum]KAA9033680.1 ROK family protein [Sphingobium limneticum]BBD03130.1 fructokinase [Sphingobium sp. YG1]